MPRAAPVTTSVPTVRAYRAAGRIPCGRVRPAPAFGSHQPKNDRLLDDCQAAIGYYWRAPESPWASAGVMAAGRYKHEARSAARKESTMKKSKAVWARPTFTVTSTGFEVTMYLGT